MFGRQKTTPTVVSEPPKDGKGHATPSRKEAQAAKRRPLVPEDRKSAAKAARAEARRQQDLEYQAMMTGDEAKMPYQHRGPVRRYIRDVADSRRTMAEFFLPVALVVLLGAMVASGPLTASGPSGTVLATVLMVLPYGYLAASAVETWVRWRHLRGDLARRFGTEAQVRGLAMYYVVRLYQIRRMRMPRPQIKSGQPPR